MGNILRFPMNAPLKHIPIKLMSTAQSQHGADAEHDPYPADDSLLASLAFVRDCLSTNPGHAGGELDPDTRRLCQEALEGAFSTAMKLERTVLNQTRHIEDMARVACTDHLTGTYNRRGFEQEFTRALASATRYGETGILVFIDLDGFKPINDTYGHAAGDRVLSDVGRALLNNVRPQDLVARIGGDEFAVLLTRTSWEDGLERAEFLKHLLNTLYVRWSGRNIAVRASFGFQRFGANGDAAQLLSSADSAMYEAKRLRSNSRHPHPGAEQ